MGAPTYADEPLENLFSLRDAGRHATLKRNIGGLYTKAAVRDLEPGIDGCVEGFLRQLAARTDRGATTTLDMSLWLHLYAYECLGVTNTSKRLGFLKEGRDVDKMIESADQIFLLVGLVCKSYPRTLFVVVCLCSARRSFRLTDIGMQFTQAPFLQWVLGRLRGLKPAEEAEPALKVCRRWKRLAHVKTIVVHLLTWNQFTLAEVEARQKSRPSATETDMLDRLLDLHAENPDKVSLREVIAAVFINL